jgi:CBS domain containing-hemolysin-like protein
VSALRHRGEDQNAAGPGAAAGKPRRRRARDGRERAARTGSRADGGADAQEQFIIDALHDLHDTVVREVMTPRVDVVALSIPLTVDSVTQAVRESGHSCFPVCGDNLDDLIGVLFVNDLFRAGWKVGGTGQDDGPPDGPVSGAPDRVEDSAGRADAEDRPSPGPIDISRRLRQPFLVPESRLVLEVLAEMRRQRRAFAVVVDEHGGVEGVLTVKDLLGALVGDLPDEFDPDDEPDVVRVDGSRWLVDGRMSVDDVRDRLDIDLPEGEYVTLGGFLFDGFGHIPAEGELLTVDGWELRVAEMDKRRIAKVVARRPEPAATAGEDGAAGGDAGTRRTPVG